MWVGKIRKWAHDQEASIISNIKLMLEIPHDIYIYIYVYIYIVLANHAAQTQRVR